MKTAAVPHPLAKFHGKRLLLDTNLLLPYFTGCFYRIHGQPPQPGPFKEEEFVLLAQIIEYFKKAGRVLTTPHILTEVSNLSRKAMGQNRIAFLSFIRFLIQDLDERFDAKRIGAKRLSSQDCFPRFGLADAAIIDLSHDSLVVLTNDKEMVRYLREKKKRRNVIDFDDLKEPSGIA
jgi:rRNA-processing protein FCF1